MKHKRYNRKWILKAFIWYCALFHVADFPRVVSFNKSVIYLAKGMTGRLDCPTDANPPVTLVEWTKDNERVQYVETTRLKVCLQCLIM